MSAVTSWISLLSQQSMLRKVCFVFHPSHHHAVYRGLFPKGMTFFFSGRCVKLIIFYFPSFFLASHMGAGNGAFPFHVVYKGSAMTSAHSMRLGLKKGDYKSHDARGSPTGCVLGLSQNGGQFGDTAEPLHSCFLPGCSPACSVIVWQWKGSGA